MKTNGNEPATGYASDNRHEKGLTKREQFAMVAMQGLLSIEKGAMNIDSFRVFSPESISKLAVLHADALISALNEQP